MQRRSLTAILAAAASCALASAASGQFWSQPADPALLPAYSNANSSIFTTQSADNFAIVEPMTLTGLTWWGQTYLSVSPFTGTELANLAGFNVTFFKNDGALPGAAVEPSRFVEIAPSLLTATPGAPHEPLGGSIHQFDLTLDPPVALPAADTYWVLITAQLTTPGAESFAWQRSSSTLLPGFATRSGDLGTWTAVGSNTAFEIFGTPGVPVGMEPSEYITLIVDQVMAMDLSLFNASDPKVAKALRAGLALGFSVVGWYIDAGWYDLAIFKLMFLSCQIDYWIVAGPERDALQQNVADLIALLAEL